LTEAVLALLAQLPWFVSGVFLGVLMGPRVQAAMRFIRRRA
jgi:hypothetical protein